MGEGAPAEVGERAEVGEPAEMADRVGARFVWIFRSVQSMHDTAHIPRR
jgi:hypothetical protein